MEQKDKRHPIQMRFWAWEAEEFDHLTCTYKKSNIACLH